MELLNIFSTSITVLAFSDTKELSLRSEKNLMGLNQESEVLDNWCQAHQTSIPNFSSWHPLMCFMKEFC